MSLIADIFLLGLLYRLLLGFFKVSIWLLYVSCWITFYLPIWLCFILPVKLTIGLLRAVF